MEKGKEGLSTIERIDIINEMVTGEPLSEKDLEVIKGLVEEFRGLHKDMVLLEREIMFLERANEELMGDLSDEYDREERDYFLDDDNWD